MRSDEEQYGGITIQRKAQGATILYTPLTHVSGFGRHALESAKEILRFAWLTYTDWISMIGDSICGYTP